MTINWRQEQKQKRQSTYQTVQANRLKRHQHFLKWNTDMSSPASNDFRPRRHDYQHWIYFPRLVSRSTESRRVIVSAAILVDTTSWTHPGHTKARVRNPRITRGSRVRFSAERKRGEDPGRTAFAVDARVRRGRALSVPVQPVSRRRRRRRRRRWETRVCARADPPRYRVPCARGDPDGEEGRRTRSGKTRGKHVGCHTTPCNPLFRDTEEVYMMWEE